MRWGTHMSTLSGVHLFGSAGAKRWLAQAHAKGSSLMQPLRPQAAQPSLGALGSAAFQVLAAADVAPEADFFQKYQACPVLTLSLFLESPALCLPIWLHLWSTGMLEII